MYKCSILNYGQSVSDNSDTLSYRTVSVRSKTGGVLGMPQRNYATMMHKKVKANLIHGYYLHA